MCVLMEIILKVIRSPINLEMNINMGGEIVPYVWPKKNAFKTKNFKGKLIFEQFMIINSLKEEIKGT